jgi:hypothetical protein
MTDHEHVVAGGHASEVGATVGVGTIDKVRIHKSPHGRGDLRAHAVLLLKGRVGKALADETLEE